PVWLHSPSDPTKLRLWDLRAAPEPSVSQILGEELGVGAGEVFSANGRWLATFSNPVDVVHLERLATSPLTEYVLPHVGVPSPVCSPDGHWLATGGWTDKTIKLWDLTSSEPEANPIVLRGHRGPIRSLAFSADGHHLVSGANDALALIWDLTTPNLSAKP